MGKIPLPLNKISTNSNNCHHCCGSYLCVISHLGPAHVASHPCWHPHSFPLPLGSSSMLFMFCRGPCMSLPCLTLSPSFLAILPLNFILQQYYVTCHFLNILEYTSTGLCISNFPCLNHFLHYQTPTSPPYFLLISAINALMLSFSRKYLGNPTTTLCPFPRLGHLPLLLPTLHCVPTLPFTTP